MKQLYYEVRNLPTNPPATLAADISRYLQMRQYVGPSLVVCDNPTAILSATRKQWFKAARYMQRLRASTLNAEEILRLTHALMHMQNMQFTPKSQADHPNADAYFAAPDAGLLPPDNCHSIYLTTTLPRAAYENIIKKLPRNSLIVSYVPDAPLDALGLEPKAVLEAKLMAIWDLLQEFLQEHGIDPARLVVGNLLQFDAMDQALDILLGVSDEFLREAAEFQYTINISQPFLTIPSDQQKRFEAVTRLAHRVQALTPGNFSTYLSTSFNDSGSSAFFLRDAISELYIDLEAAAAAIAREELP